MLMVSGAVMATWLAVWYAVDVVLQGDCGCVMWSHGVTVVVEESWAGNDSLCLKELGRVCPSMRHCASLVGHSWHLGGVVWELSQAGDSLRTKGEL